MPPYLPQDRTTVVKMSILASEHKLCQVLRAWRKTYAATSDASLGDHLELSLDTVVLLDNQTGLSRDA